MWARVSAPLPEMSVHSDHSASPARERNCHEVAPASAVHARLTCPAAGAALVG